MSNKKSQSVPQCPAMPVEEEIEEDLKAIDETETPLLTGNWILSVRLSEYSHCWFCILDDAKVLLESIGTEVVKNDTQETAQKIADNYDELEQTISSLDNKYNALIDCEKELEKIEEEIEKQIKEIIV